MTRAATSVGTADRIDRRDDDNEQQKEARKGLTHTRSIDRPTPCEPKATPGAQLFDLLFQDDRLNVYAGELEVRPPSKWNLEGVGWSIEDLQRTAWRPEATRPATAFVESPDFLRLQVLTSGRNHGT